MPGYRRQQKWLFPNSGKIEKAGSWAKRNRSFTKLKAAWRGKKVRNQWYAGGRGTLHGGRFKRRY